MTAAISVDRAQSLARLVLTKAGVDDKAAGVVAKALVAAELDGIPSHGLSRLPFYADQVISGKVNGSARPLMERVATGVVRVDACDGFAFPAIDAGIDAVEDVISAAGVMALAIARSHHAGVFGHHVSNLAQRGLVGLAFGNTPAAIAPWGGSRALFGTNPVAFGAPRRGASPLIIDLSLSVVARGKIMMAAQNDEPIPDTWAFDTEGLPTSDARTALSGTMAAIGGAKGAAFALMVEILAAGLTGGNFGFEASSFFDAAGPPPRVGQLFLIFDPERFGGEAYFAGVERLIAAIVAEPGARLPGSRREAVRRQVKKDGIVVSSALLSELENRAATHE